MSESRVEKQALARSPYARTYPPHEKIGVIVVDSFPALGQLAALRFLEWALENPEGVISLPTGKTPEHFIKWVQHLLQNWSDPDIRKLLRENGITATKPPRLHGLRFVQIDEFYPIDTRQQNSFYYYVNHYYLREFGLKPERALLIDSASIGLETGTGLSQIWPDQEVDLTLRYRHGKNTLERRQQRVLERIDQWCQEYEQKIRNMGGIGFFLGGIGPDGHIGFNVRGSDHFSTTRLSPTNYETQAAAATDLGGIEVAKKRLVITIGLGTITYNRDCVAIIIAAGEAKARIVADSIMKKPTVHYPATALHHLRNARFYLTEGAARLLPERRLVRLEAADRITDAEMERAVVELAVSKKKRIRALTEDDFRSNLVSKLVLKKRKESAAEIVQQIHQTLDQKLQHGLKVHSGKRFLHTEPHHDDLMLGYLPHIVRHVRDASNRHFFACLTSGFTAVTNAYMSAKLHKLAFFLEQRKFDGLFSNGYFAPDNRTGRNRDVWQYLDGVAADSATKKDNGVARRLLRNMIELYKLKSLAAAETKIRALIGYFSDAYPGQKDDSDVQLLKGMCREWEAECLWGYFGWNCDNVYHLRLGFYTGDIFTEEPTLRRDIPPILELLHEVKPDIVSVALDPEASGPDTHYKVLQATTEALRQYVEDTGRDDLRIWGYRNVWYRFDPSEANIFVPVSLNMFSILQNAFVNTFISQKDASFPSYEHDGPFSDLAQRIQVEQYQNMKTCLGREWFHEQGNALIRATRGLVFLREMSLEAFYEQSRKLKLAAENR